MMRKHRVVVEITADKPISAKRARNIVSVLVEQGQHAVADQPLSWRFALTKISSKEFERVLQAELRKDRKES